LARLGRLHWATTVEAGRRPGFEDYAPSWPARADQSPNTYSIDAVELSLNSGNSASICCDCFDPTSTATYCLPLIENVIGGALMPVPVLKLQSS